MGPAGDLDLNYAQDSSNKWQLLSGLLPPCFIPIVPPVVLIHFVTPLAELSSRGEFKSLSPFFGAPACGFRPPGRGCGEEVSRCMSPRSWLCSWLFSTWRPAGSFATAGRTPRARGKRASSVRRRSTGRTRSSAAGNASCATAAPARTRGWIRGAAITTDRPRSPAQRARRIRTLMQVVYSTFYCKSCKWGSVIIKIVKGKIKAWLDCLNCGMDAES